MKWPSLWNVALALLPAQLTGSMYEDDEARRETREEMVRALQSFSRSAAQWLLRLAQVLLGFSVLLVTATILYSVLYYLIIPSRLHEQEIFFDYGDHAALSLSPAARTAAPTLPTAYLNLLKPHHQWEFSPLVEMEPTDTRVLVPGVKYDVFVELEMPESQVNRDIGMFMLQTTLKSHDGEFLASSARSAIVKDSHSLVELVRVFSWLVPYALRVTEPSQTVRVLAVNGFKEGKQHPLTSVTLVLNHPAVQIYSARLTIIAQLAGVRYLMYHWSVSTAVLVILNFVFVEALGLLILYAYYNLPVPDTDDTRHKSPITTDQGKVFEQNRSGGIPPVHVERAMKEEPMETAELLNRASAGELLSALQEEEMQLRYRKSASEETMAAALAASLKDE
ncbi:hypothetical protein Poli38472_013543 [Pythium oligandrum]|uniref:Seipin n=1 Tax=Pythium oligandrum TaxID=41045 RepID=A0A8K1C7V7_PYTOL|nr:hypothetical protein Poli38472_013543 [Pythium oligandrum]|eukprot:TMW58069.1 hypothetical protein Poli38472_013543 [Pythium oligandrum]